MLSLRLGSIASNLYKSSRSTSLIFQRNLNKFSAEKSDDIVDDEPVKYSTSKAADWKAEQNRIRKSEVVWFTPYAISLSVGVFLLYFCVLREENDIDEIIYRPLPQTLKGIDKLFPEFDFETKPDYVLYHEEKNREKKLSSSK